MHAVILTESGQERGYGHIVRCAALAQAFMEAGAAVRLIVDGEIPSFLDAAVKRMVTTAAWLTDSAVLREAIEKGESRGNQELVAVLDSYEAEPRIYETLSDLANVLIVYDDGHVDHEFSGISLNGAPGSGECFSTDQGHLALRGPRYQTLRKEFWDTPERPDHREQIGTMLVLFGGTDSRGLAARLLSPLREQFSHVEIRVPSSGTSGQNLRFVGPLSAADVASEMLGADVAVSAAGQTVSELARCGVPTVLIGVAENQSHNVAAWQELGFALLGGWWNQEGLEGGVISRLRELQDPSLRRKLGSLGQATVDGQGARRVVLRARTWDFFVGSCRVRNFLSLSASEREEVREWRNDPAVREHMSVTELISSDQHRRFHQILAQDLSRCNWVVELEEQPLGVITLSDIDWKQGKAELGLYKCPGSYRPGGGGILLDTLERLSRERLGLSALHLKVRKDNQRALRLYLRRGYGETGGDETYRYMSKEL